MLRFALFGSLSLVASALVLQACSDNDSARPSGDASTTDVVEAGQAPDAGPGIHGSLVVYVRGCTGQVDLGDGTRFHAPVEEDPAHRELGCRARFEDPAIVGPQTITWAALAEVGREVVVSKTYTIAGVDRPEVWMDGAGVAPPPSSKQLAQLQGRIDGLADAGDGDFLISALAPASGSIIRQTPDYALDVYGVEGTTSADVVAIRRGTPAFLRGTATRLGMRRNVLLSNAGPVDITLDQAFDQSFNVTLPSIVGRVAQSKVSLRWFPESLNAVETEAETTESSIALAALPTRAPFEARRLRAVSTYANAWSFIDMSVPLGAMTASAAFAPVPVLTEPEAIPSDQTGPLPDVPIVPGAFRIAWQGADAQASVIRIDVSCEKDKRVLHSVVDVHANSESFTFPGHAVPCGRVDTTVTLETTFADAQGDLLGARPAEKWIGTVRQTRGSYRFYAADVVRTAVRAPVEGKR